jgi:hypothetical protein
VTPKRANSALVAISNLPNHINASKTQSVKMKHEIKPRKKRVSRVQKNTEYIIKDRMSSR